MSARHDLFLPFNSHVTLSNTVFGPCKMQSLYRNFAVLSSSPHQGLRYYNFSLYSQKRSEGSIKTALRQMVEKWTGIFITLLMKFTEAIQSSSYITNQFSNTLHQSSSNTFSFYNHQYTHIQTYSFQPQLFHNNWML